jgi:hypothetical protein
MSENRNATFEDMFLQPLEILKCLEDLDPIFAELGDDDSVFEPQKRFQVDDNSTSNFFSDTQEEVSSSKPIEKNRRKKVSTSTGSPISCSGSSLSLAGSPLSSTDSFSPSNQDLERFNVGTPEIGQLYQAEGVCQVR